MMESFSRTLDTYTGSFVARRRKRRILIAGAVLFVAVGIALIVYFLAKSPGSAKDANDRPASRQSIAAGWKARQWDAVLSACSRSLQNHPLDSYYLGFAGLASFYKGSEMPDSEDRAALMDQSVVYLRKTLVVEERDHQWVLPRAELEYVLGKALFNKGDAYWDEAVKSLEASLAHGYLAEDSREYLAVAYAGLGNGQKAVENFEAALARKRTDLLLIAAGKAYVDMGKSDRGEALLLEALSKSGDVLAREKCRFLLASVYEMRGELKKAQDQIQLVIKENADSAEAHYRLGLILQKAGDPVGARSEWRKAVSIDPMNADARQKLSEKL
jgi:tetratricopeptide (TPR) repeat protein